MFTNILIPTDGSELSEKVIIDGVTLAKTLQARITGVHVIHIPYIAFTGDEFAPFDPNLQVHIEQAARTAANRYLDRIEAAAHSAGVTFERVLSEQAQPWKGILEAAGKHRCDLIMMAAHGRRGIAALILGSETNRVLTHSRIPVLVYR